MHDDAMVDANLQARELMACLGDASRWRLVQVLRGGPLCVTELAAGVDLSQSCTTRHLQVLTRAGIVERRRMGKRVLFRVRSEEDAIASLLAWAEGSAPALVPPPDRADKPRTPSAKRDRKLSSTPIAGPDETKEVVAPRPRPRPPRPGDLEDYLL